MDLIRNIKKRIFMSSVIGMFVCVLMLGEFEQRMSLAWWGFLYPEYCFMEVSESEFEIEQENRDINKNVNSGICDQRNEIQNGKAENGKIEEEKHKSGEIKISFWLAKVFDW